MKTKTKPQSKFFVALATILCCMLSLNSFAQNSIVPTFQDFHGTWVGTNADGRPVEITLTSDWKCTFNTVNGVPMHADNPVVAYRMPQFDPRTVATNGPPADPEITVKFYTQAAMSGIRVPASSSNASSAGDNSLTPNTIEQIYTGLAVLSLNTAGQMEMTLYMDAVNYNAAPPVLTPSPGDVAYCVLVRQ